MEVGREMGGSFVPWWQKVSRKPCATMAESMDGSPCAMMAERWIVVLRCHSRK